MLRPVTIIVYKLSLLKIMLASKAHKGMGGLCESNKGY